MYLRRNKVRCGDTRRTYLSIAHNVWWPKEAGGKAQSRPVVVASLGVEEDIDLEIVRDLVVAVERCAPRFSCRRGESRAATVRVAQDMRRIETYLKMLASRRLGLSALLPAGDERVSTLESLVRDKLAEPDPLPREAEILSRVRSQLCA